MSDFTQTMKDWRRMCKAHEHCVGCPLEKYDIGCLNKEEMDYDVMERVIDEWAKQHPEPKYPTWGEWLIRQGLVNAIPYWSPSIPSGNTTITCLSNKALYPIPADIAEKLGIRPKEC